MKLTTLYYRHIMPTMMALFLASIVSAFFLIRKTLRQELDGALLRSKSRVENYVQLNGRLPEVSSFNDQLIVFRPVSALKEIRFSDTMQYIAEQRKNHISRKLSFTMLLNGRPWEGTISQPLEGTRHLTILIGEIAVATISVTLFLFVLINRLVLSRLWRPFYRSLELIESFKLDQPMPHSYPESSVEEFRLMNAHFLKASENASRDYHNLKEFSENASHELQTPLAIIRSNLDMLAQEGITERHSELMQGVYTAVRRMSRLQESLLLLTKIDNRQFDTQTVIRIDCLMHEKIMQLQELLHAQNLDCRLELTEVTLSANQDLLDILLNNLFSNAIRHNVPDGSIYARLETNSLQVSNTGVPEALDHQRIFRRFYKKESQPGSNGLGLSIIKRICDTTSMQVEYSFSESRHSFTISWQPS